MIAVHRDYCLSNSSDLHAHVKVNPVGKLEVEIVELQERHESSVVQTNEVHEGELSKDVG